MAATLYAVPASHPCACVERALQLKRVAYRRRDWLPVVHKPIQLAMFGGGTVPGLALDGRRVLGSRAAVRALEEVAPQPALLPHGEKERKPIELAEEWGDEVLQRLVRRVLWAALRRAPEAMPSYSQGSGLRVPAALARLSAPLIADAERRINRASDLNVRADLAGLPHHLGRIERWIEHDVIGGEQPNAADLQIAAGLRLLLTIEDVAAAIGSRPAVSLARRWFERYPGRAPAGTLPAEWLAPISA